MKKINIDIETIGDLQLDVQTAVETTETDEGHLQEKGCICFAISGCNSQTDKEVEEYVFISMEEAQRLSMLLGKLFINEN